MDPLFTPTTALLYSLLEPSVFESPSASQCTAATEPDVFGHAFGEHNSKDAALGEYRGVDGSSTDASSQAAMDQDIFCHAFGKHNVLGFGMVRNEVAEAYISPAGTDDLSCDLRIGNSDDNSASRAVNAGKLCQPPEPVISQKRNRKRRPLDAEEKSWRHAQFLERNRVAADKCRKRKKVSNEGLEEQCRILGKRNEVLKDIKDDLMAEIAELRVRVKTRAVEETEGIAIYEGKEIEKDTPELE